MSGYIRLPRSLRTDPQWREFSAKERHVFEELYHRMAFSILELDDHGKMIVVHPGQLLTTYRQIADWCNDSRPSDWRDEKQPEKIIKFEKNFIHRFLQKLERCQKVRQEVRHIKTIVTIVYDGFIKNSETGSETRVGQEWDTKEERQERKEGYLVNPPTPQKGGRPIGRVGRSNIKNQKEEMEQEHEPKLTFRTKRSPGAAFITYKRLHESLLKEMYTFEQIETAIETFKVQNPKIGGSDPISYIKSIIENQIKELSNGSTKHRSKKNSVSRELSDFTESTTDWGYLRSQAHGR